MEAKAREAQTGTAPEILQLVASNVETYGDVVAKGVKMLDLGLGVDLILKTEPAELELAVPKGVITAIRDLSLRSALRVIHNRAGTDYPDSRFPFKNIRVRVGGNGLSIHDNDAGFSLHADAGVIIHRELTHDGLFIRINDPVGAQRDLLHLATTKIADGLYRWSAQNRLDLGFTGEDVDALILKVRRRVVPVDRDLFTLERIEELPSGISV